jgi:two-component system cell cycle sensor histidine kinase/response regulator CckA
MTATATLRSKILVVDDELGPRESLRMLLKPHYDVRTADNPHRGLSEIDGFRPDLAILDIKMPEMDGLELLKRIKGIDPSIEVVMITAYASLETVKQALSHGAFEYLIKPFARQDLEEVVRRALVRRQADLGARGQIVALVEEMRGLATKTRQLEEAARREAAEQSLRVTQLSILREISRTIVGQLDQPDVADAVTGQVQRALGYDRVTIAMAPPRPAPAESDPVVVCAVRDAEGTLGYLVADNRASGRPIDPRERELLEMLSEYLAIALRNSRLYTEIATTKQSLEQLIASAADAIIPLDAEDRIQAWNPAAVRIFGLSAQAAIGHRLGEILPNVDFEQTRQQLAAGAPMRTFEVSGVPGPARPLTLAVTISPLGPQPGEVGRLLAIVHDISAQRDMENQLHQSEKLTALGQLAGGIAHDFNNLLQAIIGYAQLMKQNPTDVELITRSLQVLETAAVDGSETVRRIQQFARLRPDEAFVTVNLNKVAQDAAAITRPRWAETMAHDGRSPSLRLDLGSVPPISGRPAALTEVMTNLILNAIDAMPGGGVLSIRTRHADDAALVIVEDTGTGMPESVRRRIFEPFFSTKGERGSGLGLAMAYSIVRRHGGEIRVDSTVGKGTTFTLSFPVATESSALETASKRPTERRNARLLLVDDDPKVLASMGEVLQAQGHAVTMAATGDAALGAFAPGRYDVLLVNVGMANMNGWGLAERLRERDGAVPILFITGWGIREVDRPRLTALKIQSCLFKPVKPDELDAAIQAALLPRAGS